MQSSAQICMPYAAVSCDQPSVRWVWPMEELVFSLLLQASALIGSRLIPVGVS